MPLELAQPEIPHAQNPMDSFFKGFSMMSAIVAKHKDDELAAQKMVQEANLRNRGYDLESRGQDLNYKVAEARQSSLDEERQFRLGRTQSQLQAAANLVQNVRDIPDPVGSQDWKTQAFTHLLNNPDAELTPAYKSIYEQVKPRLTQNDQGQKTYDGMVAHLGINKNLVNAAIENPTDFTKTDSSTPDKVFIYAGARPIKQTVKDPNTGNPVVQDVQEKIYQPINKSSWDALRKYRQTFGTPLSEVPGASTVQSEAAKAKQVIATPGADVNGVKVLFKQKYGIDLDSVDSMGGQPDNSD